MRDSLTFDLQLEAPVTWTAFIKGTVRNISATPMHGVMAEVFDSEGNSRTVTVGDVPPRQPASRPTPRPVRRR